MNTSIVQQLNLPPMDQVGFVVVDMDEALSAYQPLFGEFKVHRYGEMTWDYRGTQEASELIIAIAHSGTIEIELIQWVSGLSPHKEFIDAGREGMHHLRFPVQNLEKHLEQAANTGYLPIWKKRFNEGLAAAYLERENDPLIIEFFENNRASP